MKNTINAVAKWIKNTDLAEIVYKKNGAGFELRTEAAPVRSNIPGCQLVPVNSPAVGIYRACPAGESRVFKEGMALKAGETLGYVEILKDKKPLASPVKGILRVICIEDGKPVQYGQPVFFIEPS